jgi:hypothetical protein
MIVHQCPAKLAIQNARPPPREFAPSIPRSPSAVSVAAGFACFLCRSWTHRIVLVPGATTNVPTAYELDRFTSRVTLINLNGRQRLTDNAKKIPLPGPGDGTMCDSSATNAARAFLELGAPLKAWEMLEDLPPERTDPDVFSCRLPAAGRAGDPDEAGEMGTRARTPAPS